MRDKAIDGFRAVAALGVVAAHAVSYRFGAIPSLHYAQRIATPLAQTSVQLFFLISGFIITSLLDREHAANGRISIRAFYIRRICRIVPPLAAVLAVVAALSLTDPLSLAHATTFTCNIGECQWAVAHTWSLSVEEQFYLVWPMLLVIVGNRPWLIAVSIALMLLAFLAAPFAWHSNYVSFACIGMGALYALSPGLRRTVERSAKLPAWSLVAVALLLGPLYLPPRAEALAPLLILYLLFAGRELKSVKLVLESAPLQIVGLSSYSLYLWQQLFLGKGNVAPLWLLPFVVAGSVLLVEQPFILLGRRFNSAYPLRSASLIDADEMTV